MGKVSDALSWYQNREPDRMALNFFFLISVVIFIVYRKGVKRIKDTQSLPPGPRALPVLGYLPFLRLDLHCCFADLAQTFGSVMMMRIGSRQCIIVSSSEAAREMCRDHDVTFANHDTTAAARIISFGMQDIGFQPYSPKWRTLRKACVRELLNTKILDSFHALHQREVRSMVEELHRKTGEVVDVGQVAFVTVLNVVTGMLWGNSLAAEEQKRVGGELRELVDGIVHLLGVTNMSDIFPVLEWMDLQGVQRKMKEHKERLDRLLSMIIEQRKGTLEASGDQEKTKDFLQVMLEMLKEDPHQLLTMDNIKGIFTDIVTAGTDTTSITVEWTLAEMMNRPETIRKAQEELESVVGKEEMVDETHLPKLHYLEALVKESLRLHPPIPLLLPRYPTATCSIGGYMIPKGAKIFINAWAIHRNPTVWENPSEFIPERFLERMNRWDYYGSNNFNFIPFGFGRRICMGIPLAEKMNKFILATMLHSFEWRLPDNSKLDLVEKFGIVLKKEKPLVAIATARPSCAKLNK
ncbi:flavonoid 3'-monooxygenase CYP75B137-like [Dioscorea cayenensis subsp. rotundata]|uniref:Flavonoid 3'-monooxygenase CYP75B137-like n=1 Tax=Dioscorea cayennensis subsp. rotundata TaxID=55577 RepID=A0AB40C545_DIOCR|nr:flavonoid 3'-monooxygenase CYP75B137-like [Dioscorea cayenensis subsp. rotundata]